MNPEDITSVGKLAQLENLRSHGINVPTFMGITNRQKDYSHVKKWFSEQRIERVSVRSSPAFSMPGMLDTVLDVPIEDIDEHVIAIFDSVNSKRAQTYLRNQKLATPAMNVVVQSMIKVQGPLSGAGVMYTHDTQSGLLTTNGVFLEGSQGDSVVSNSSDCKSLIENPILLSYLQSPAEEIRKLYTWPQEIEFTYIRSDIWILQTRRCNMPLMTHLRMLSNMGGLSREDELWELRMLPKEVLTIKGEPLYSGVGMAGGRSIVRRDRILIQDFVTNDDMANIHLYDAIISRTGNIGSHPVTLCRNLGLPYIRMDNLECQLPDTVAIDGYSGEIHPVENATKETITHENYRRFV